MIHDRIRRARVLRGLSLEELAQRLGDITKQGLSKFEKGEPPNSSRILQLAKALDVKPEYFFRTDTVEIASLEFRKLSKMPKSRQQQVREQISEHLERYVALERCFSVDEGLVRKIPPRSLPIGSIADAEGAAQQLRKRLQIGNDAIAQLTELLEERGIKVVLLDDVEDFDGACATTDDDQHVLIALNRKHPGERMRFTAAHELGHWVMACSKDMQEADKESACHRFAGAFLYPSDRVLADFGAHKRPRVFAAELLNAKRRYGVSMQVASRRLKDLHLLTDAGYRHACIEFSQRGWRHAEPEPLLAEHPRRFESLVFRGLASDLFGPSRAAEFMQCDVDALDPTLSQLQKIA